jgi:uncharacterized membrane protein
MRNFIITYGAAAIVLIVLEFAWLSQTAGPLYRKTLGAIMAEKPKMSAAVAFYIVYVLGVVIFAVHPEQEAGDWHNALLRGALFGFFAYATYDLTNLATLRIWSLKISLIDMAWGTFVTGISASLSALAMGMIGK